MELIVYILTCGCLGCVVAILNILKKVKKSVDSYDKRISDLEFGIRGYYNCGGNSDVLT